MKCKIRKDLVENYSIDESNWISAEFSDLVVVLGMASAFKPRVLHLTWLILAGVFMSKVRVWTSGCSFPRGIELRQNFYNSFPDSLLSVLKYSLSCIVKKCLFPASLEATVTVMWTDCGSAKILVTKCFFEKGCDYSKMLVAIFSIISLRTRFSGIVQNYSFPAYLV